MEGDVPMSIIDSKCGWMQRVSTIVRKRPQQASNETRDETSYIIMNAEACSI